jgi:sulfoxide reductase heme-binding subunit YedZ
VVWILCLLPFGRLLYGAFTADLGTDPVETLLHWCGLSALTLLFLTLAVTPLQRLTHTQALVRFRRLLGLFAFFYASLHVLTYAIFDQSLSPALIADDVARHPWVLLGATAFVLLAALAATSTRRSIRRLGGRRWNRLHRAIYLAAPLAVLHFYLSVKLDVTLPLRYAAVLGALLLVRFAVRHRRAVRRPAPGVVASPGADA